MFANILTHCKEFDHLIIKTFIHKNEMKVGLLLFFDKIIYSKRNVFFSHIKTSKRLQNWEVKKFVSIFSARKWKIVRDQCQQVAFFHQNFASGKKWIVLLKCSTRKVVHATFILNMCVFFDQFYYYFIHLIEMIISRKLPFLAGLIVCRYSLQSYFFEKDLLPTVLWSYKTKLVVV